MNPILFSSPDIEFVLAHFHLEFQQKFHLGLSEMLRLRRNLTAAAHQVLGNRYSTRFQNLFDPPLSDDPVALRRFQRPSPPFAILPEPTDIHDYDAGDRLDLKVSCWGRGGRLLDDFSLVLKELGRAGYHRGNGFFELVSIETEDSSANRAHIWIKNDNFHFLSPSFNDVGWWLSRNSIADSVRLEFLTPARLISQGRPLFRVNFKRLFPFMLRRVSSMLYAHCGREVIDDPGHLLAAASKVREAENSLHWQDWRTLEGQGEVQDLGGIVGSVLLGGDALPEVLDILRLATLMNVGKGAAFGAGRFRLCETSSERP